MNSKSNEDTTEAAEKSFVEIKSEEGGEDLKVKQIKQRHTIEAEEKSNQGRRRGTIDESNLKVKQICTLTDTYCSEFTASGNV